MAAAGQLQAAGAGQHPVQQDQVGYAFGDLRLRFARIAGQHRVEIALAQGVGDHVADRGFVVDDQDALVHGRCAGGRQPGSRQVNDVFVTPS